MSKTKTDKAAELAERMLQVLEAQRSFGGDAYPPTLQHLGELCDGSPTSELIVKAAAKKVFKNRAVVDQAGKDASLRNEVYFKEDRPREEVRLARRMLQILEAQRRLGGDAYPPTLRRLAELGGFKPADGALRKAAATEPMAGRTMVVGQKGKALVVDAPVILKDDLEGDLHPIFGGLLRYALGPVVSRAKKGTSETAAFPPSEVLKRVRPELRSRFEHAIREGIRHLSLPGGVAWVSFKGGPLLFLTENLKPGAAQAEARSEGHVAAVHRHEPTAFAPPSDGFLARDFNQAFRAAFEILDRRNGLTNFVKLADLRQALNEFGREEFDAGLRRLRIEGDFSLDSHEGLHGSLSHEEREAGVREAGSLLVYASRR